MRGIIVSLLTACLGSAGFAVVFRARLRHVPVSAFGGLLAWGVYLLCMGMDAGILLSCLLASVAASVYAAVAARLLHAPATIFLVPSTVPLVPGGSLYYAFRFLLERNYAGFADSLAETVMAASGIAVGIVAVSLTEKLAGDRRRIPRGTKTGKRE